MNATDYWKISLGILALNLVYSLVLAFMRGFKLLTEAYMIFILLAIVISIVLVYMKNKIGFFIVMVFGIIGAFVFAVNILMGLLVGVPDNFSLDFFNIIVDLANIMLLISIWKSKPLFFEGKNEVLL